MAAQRQNIQDFIRDINAQTGANGSPNTYAGSLNADGSVKITKNGTTLFPKVIWPAQPIAAKTDAGGSNVDSCYVQDAGSLNYNVVSAQQLINSLT